MKFFTTIVVVIFSATSFAQVEINWGMHEKLDAYHVIATKFKKDIESLTNGQVKINLKKYKDDPRDPLEEIKSGKIQIYQVSSSILPSLASDKNPHWIKAWDMPFLFKDKKHVEAYIGSKHAQTRVSLLESDKIMPLTYSYAGGFLAVLSDRKNNVINFDTLKPCTENLDSPDSEKLLASLPCRMLQYALEDLLSLNDDLKKKLEVHISGHLVESRLTFVSKEHIAMIPEQYQQKFVARLRKLLDEERHTIYESSEKNIKLVKKDKYLKISDWDVRKRSVASDDYVQKAFWMPEGLKEEVDFIKKLRD